MKLNVNNYMMAYTDTGKGMPLIFIHGYPLSREMWEPQIKGLSAMVRVIAPDLRGHGESQAVPGPYSMEIFADDIAGLLDALEIQTKVVICGLSMGGYAAFAFYRKYTHRVGGLILAATRAGEDTPQARAGREQAVETAKSEGIEVIVDGMIPNLLSPENYQNHPDLVRKVKSILMSISLDGMIGDLEGMKTRPDSRPTLEKIDVPTLVLHGLEDQIIPPKTAKETRAAIQHSRLQIIPRAGHLLNLEQPAEFNAAVRGFLSGIKVDEHP
jgi:pimeloyl-ACP methyl ester carboxylesterase